MLRVKKILENWKEKRNTDPELAKKEARVVWQMGRKKKPTRSTHCLLASTTFTGRFLPEKEEEEEEKEQITSAN